jgi:transcriptional regulator with GAF, ATPase, and Fis domain
MGTPHAFLDLVEPSSDRLNPQIGLGALAQAVNFKVEKGEGLAGKVWESGAPLVIDNYDSWSGRVTAFERGAIRSVMGVPLLSGKRVTGVLGLAYDWNTGESFDSSSIVTTHPVRYRVDPRGPTE